MVCLVTDRDDHIWNALLSWWHLWIVRVHREHNVIEPVLGYSLLPSKTTSNTIKSNSEGVWANSFRSSQAIMYWDRFVKLIKLQICRTRRHNASGRDTLQHPTFRLPIVCGRWQSTSETLWFSSRLNAFDSQKDRPIYRTLYIACIRRGELHSIPCNSLAREV